jgi:transcriptional regulator with XRE-family HTH domain
MLTRCLTSIEIGRRRRPSPRSIPASVGVKSKMVTPRKTGRPPVKQAIGADRIVGERLRMRRKQLGMSQEKLGAALGITFQQIQKYEKGTNRISVGRLVRMAEVLETPITWFLPEDTFGLVGKRPLPLPPAVTERLNHVADRLTSCAGEFRDMAKEVRAS